MNKISIKLVDGTIVSRHTRIVHTNDGIKDSVMYKKDKYLVVKGTDEFYTLGEKLPKEVPRQIPNQEE